MLLPRQNGIPRKASYLRPILRYIFWLFAASLPFPSHWRCLQQQHFHPLVPIFLFVSTLILPLFVFVFGNPFYYLPTFSSFSFSFPRRNSGPGSLSRLSSPLPATVRALIFIARRLQPFLPLSTPALSSLVDSHRITLYSYPGLPGIIRKYWAGSTTYATLLTYF